MDTNTTSSIMHPSYACHTNNRDHHNSFYNSITLCSEKYLLHMELYYYIFTFKSKGKRYKKLDKFVMRQEETENSLT